MITTRASSNDPLFDGRFEFVRVLGAGGMSRVLLCHDHQTGKKVALKLLNSNYYERTDVLYRFEAEARSMMAIDHRNVLSVHYVSEGAEPFFAMEYAEGGSLADWVERHGAMPARMAADAVMQTCKGVGAAHAAGVVHRDIKSHNVLITRRGVCRVADFGIAQTELSYLTQADVSMGSLGFMAPEQRNDAKSVGPSADVYSLGATLFHLLTTRISVELFVAGEDPTLLRGVHPALVPILVKATRYNPEERYSSGAEMARAIYDVRHELERPPPSTPPLTSLLEEDDPTQSSFLTPVDAQIPWEPPSMERPPSSARRGWAGERDATNGPAAESVSASVPGLESARSVAPMVPTGIAVTVVAMLTACMVLGTNTFRAQAADRSALEAHEAWHGVILQKENAVDQVEALGGSTAGLTADLRRLKMQGAEPERTEQAHRYLRSLREASEPLSTGESDSAKRLRGSLAAVQTAEQARRDAIAASAEARRASGISLLLYLGLLDEDPMREIPR